MIFVTLAKGIVQKFVNPKKVQLTLLEYFGVHESGTEIFENRGSSQDYKLEANGHLLKFKIEINSETNNFEIYVKVCILDEDVPDINEMIKSVPVDFENDKKIEIRGKYFSESA